MLAKFHIRHQGKLLFVHQCDVPDGTSVYTLRGSIQITPTGGETSTLTEVIKFQRVQAELLDYAFFLFDADAEVKKFADNGGFDKNG